MKARLAKICPLLPFALLLALVPQIFPQEKEEVSRNEITIKSSKDIRCKEFFLDLRIWKDGKLAKQRLKEV